MATHPCLRDRHHITTFLCHFVPHEHMQELQRCLSLICNNALPDAGSRAKKITRSQAQCNKRKEEDHFLALQWTPLLSRQSHRTCWSHWLLCWCQLLDL